MTKKTVFKWQEGFWLKMKVRHGARPSQCHSLPLQDVFDAEYKEKYVAAGLLDGCDTHTIVSRM